MDKLGIETSLLLAQLFNFTIIMVVLQKLLYKPILGMLEKRRKKIEEGLALTEKMESEQAKLEIKKENVLADAREEGRKIIEEAKKQAKEEEKIILADAQKMADDLIEKAKKTAEHRGEEMEKTKQAESIKLAEAMAKRLLSEVMSADMQHKLITAHIKELSHVHVS